MPRPSARASVPAASRARRARHWSGCALFGASGAAALLITLGLGVPVLAPFLFPFVFLVTLTIGGLLGLPLFFTAMQLGRVNIVSAAFAGFATGASWPTVSALIGNGDDWRAIILFGAAGAVGGITFWSLLLERQGGRWS